MEASAKVSSEQVMAMLDEIASTQGTGSGDLQTALAMKSAEGVRIYFAESMLGLSSPMGPVASILGLTKFDFLGQPDLTWSQIATARVFFFDAPGENGRNNGMIIGYSKTGETAMTYVGFTGTGTLEDSQLTTRLSANGVEKLILRSYEVSGGDLQNVIQLLAWETDGGGGEGFIGKFSVLVGFGD